MDLNLNFNQILQLISQLPQKQKELIQSFLSEDLNPKPNNPTSKRKAGALKGFITYMAEDFDAPLNDMKDHM